MGKMQLGAIQTRNSDGTLDPVRNYPSVKQQMLAAGGPVVAITGAFGGDKSFNKFASNNWEPFGSVYLSNNGVLQPQIKPISGDGESIENKRYGFGVTKDGKVEVFLGGFPNPTSSRWSNDTAKQKDEARRLTEFNNKYVSVFTGFGALTVPSDSNQPVEQWNLSSKLIRGDIQQIPNPNNAYFPLVRDRNSALDQSNLRGDELKADPTKYGKTSLQDGLQSGIRSRVAIFIPKEDPSKMLSIYLESGFLIEDQQEQIKKLVESQGFKFDGYTLICDSGSRSRFWSKDEKNTPTDYPDTLRKAPKAFYSNDPAPTYMIAAFPKNRVN